MRSSVQQPCKRDERVRDRREGHSIFVLFLQITITAFVYLTNVNLMKVVFPNCGVFFVH